MFMLSNPHEDSVNNMKAREQTRTQGMLGHANYRVLVRFHIGVGTILIGSLNTKP